MMSLVQDRLQSKVDRANRSSAVAVALGVREAPHDRGPGLVRGWPKSKEPGFSRCVKHEHVGFDSPDHNSKPTAAFAHLRISAAACRTCTTSCMGKGLYVD